MEKALWRANLRRAFYTPYFYVSTALIAAVILITAAGITRKSTGVIETFRTTIGGSGIDSLIYGILPPVAFAMNYSDDQNAGAVNFWTIRSGTGRYARGQFAASVLFGFAAVFFGAILAIVLLIGIAPDPFSYDTSYNGELTVFLHNRQPVLYLLFLCAELGLSGAIAAGVGAWVGALFPSRLTTLAAPLALYMLLLRILSFPNLPPYLNIASLLQGGYNINGDWLLSLSVKLAITVVLCVILGEASVFHIRRRQRHA